MISGCCSLYARTDGSGRTPVRENSMKFFSQVAAKKLILNRDLPRKKPVAKVCRSGQNIGQTTHPRKRLLSAVLVKNLTPPPVRHKILTMRSRIIKCNEEQKNEKI